MDHMNNQEKRLLKNIKEEDRDKAEAEHENIERQKTTNGIF
jgi:hypothetical protein